MKNQNRRGHARRWCCGEVVDHDGEAFFWLKDRRHPVFKSVMAKLEWMGWLTRILNRHETQRRLGNK